MEAGRGGGDNHHSKSASTWVAHVNFSRSVLVRTLFSGTSYCLHQATEIRGSAQVTSISSEDSRAVVSQRRRTDVVDLGRSERNLCSQGVSRSSGNQEKGRGAAPLPSSLSVALVLATWMRSSSFCSAVTIRSSDMRVSS